MVFQWTEEGYGLTNSALHMKYSFFLLSQSVRKEEVKTMQEENQEEKLTKE